MSAPSPYPATHPATLPWRLCQARSSLAAAAAALFVVTLLTGCQGSNPKQTAAPINGAPTTAGNREGQLPKPLEGVVAQRQQAAGHQATVRCLRSERAMTDGDELRCEDWSYVRSNYTTATEQ